MTKLTTHLSQQAVNLADVGGEDRETYRRWAYGWLMAYAVLIGGLAVSCIRMRHEPDTMEAARTFSIEHTGISKSPMAQTGTIESRK